MFCLCDDHCFFTRFAGRAYRLALRLSVGSSRSVHLRVLDGSSYGPEQQELALESLLEFTREPALMTDVYINYDCDVQCTNLFETICHSLSTHALPRDGMVSGMSRIGTTISPVV